jgi:hypothetical protein
MNHTILIAPEFAIQPDQRDRFAEVSSLANPLLNPSSVTANREEKNYHRAAESLLERQGSHF